MKEVKFDLIRLDSGAQVRVRLDERVVAQHAIAMEEGATLPPLPAPSAEGAISNDVFGARPALPVVEAVTCLAAYGYEVPDDGLMHGVPSRD
jgi:hypothetical protein